MKEKNYWNYRRGNHKLRIETSRFDQFPKANKLYPICKSNRIEFESHFLMYCITALIILPWTPEICLECLLCCNQSQMRSSHHRNHKATKGFLSTTEEIIFVLFNDTSCLVRNLKHHCSPRSALRTTSSTSFEFRTKNFTSQRDATTTSFQGSDITWR